MSVKKVASRYAKSLLDLSVENNNLEAIKSDMESLLEVAKNRDFTLLLDSPIVSISKKTTCLNQIFAGQVNDLTLNFFEIVTKKGREALLPSIASEFLAQYNEKNAISSIKLTTADALSVEGLESIKAKLQEQGVINNNVTVETAVDPSIIGGFIVEIGDKLIDNSISYKLKSMSKALLS